MTSLLTSARKRRAALLQELAALDHLISVYESQEVSRPRVTNDANSIVEAVKEILLASNTPLRQKELVNALSERGITVEGRNPCHALGTILWRSKAFDTDDRGYKVKDMPHSLNGRTTVS